MSTPTTPPALASVAGSDLEWRIHTSRLLEEIAKHSEQPALIKPIQILGRLLAQVGERASELHDRKLDALMMRLTIYTVADPESPDYDAAIVADYLRQNAVSDGETGGQP